VSEQIDREEQHGTAHEASLTGHDAVDGVLRSLEGLEEQPVDEHVAVFEAAHETLRAALADAGRPSGPSGS
jgi:hypothetical protein